MTLQYNSFIYVSITQTDSYNQKLSFNIRVLLLDVLFSLCMYAIMSACSPATLLK